jgi:hypothetical protein
LKQVFQISFPEKEIIQPVLALLIGEKHCSFAITDHSSGQLKQLVYYTVPQVDETVLSSLFSSHPELDQAFQKVKIGYQLSQAVLVPSGYFQHEQQSAMLKALFGINSSMNVISESIPAKQLHLVYTINGKIYRLLSSRFTTANYWHQTGVIIKNSLVSGIYLDFMQEDFSAVVFEEDKLLFAGSFNYLTPTDVLYHLLKIIDCFRLSQQETKLMISGLLDKSSALYAELLQYFLQVEFRTTSWQTEYPSHYFASLNDLAQCE